jgi:hypothetical protein
VSSRAQSRERHFSRKMKWANNSNRIPMIIYVCSA